MPTSPSEDEQSSENQRSPPRLAADSGATDCGAFPRNSWDYSTLPLLPIPPRADLPGRTIWAGFRASRALAAQLEAGVPVDAVTFRLAVFDKVLELNAAERSARNANGPKYIRFREWLERVEEIADEVVQSAITVLTARGLDVPPNDRAVTFAVAAMSQCWEPTDSVYMGPCTPYATSVLGPYDPDEGDILSDARDVPGVGESVISSAKVEYDHATGGWRVLEYGIFPAWPLSKNSSASQ